MRVHEKDIGAIRLIRKRHLLPQLILFILAHHSQRSLILPIQPVIPHPHHHDHKAQRRKRGDDADLAGDVSRRFFGLEGLRAEDVADAESDQGHGVGRHLFRMAGDVGSVPGEEEHEGGSECAGEEGTGEETGFALGMSVWVEAYEEGSS